MELKHELLMPVDNADVENMDTDDLVHFTTTLILTLGRARHELRKRVKGLKDVEDDKEATQ